MTISSAGTFGLALCSTSAPSLPSPDENTSSSSGESSADISPTLLTTI